MFRSATWYTLVIFFVGIIVFFLNLGSMTVDIMEARNFVTVREMIQSGDWLHPTLNGELRLEKPPLPTWITAVFASIFGIKDLFFLRLPASLMSLWLLFSMNSLVFRLSKNKRLAMLSAIVLGGMLYVVLLGRRGTWDIYTHSFMLASIVQLVIIFQSEGGLLRALWAGLLFGLAFLSKGPVALYTLFIPFLIAYFIQYKVHCRKIILPISLFSITAILVSASWFVYTHFLWQDVAVEVFGKEIANWKSYNTRPWYYYLKDYPVHSGIWTLILAIGLLTKYNYNKTPYKKEYILFWLWTVISIVLLSAVPEKKVRYLLPTFIPASFIVGSYLHFLLADFTYKKKTDTIIFHIHWVVFALATIGLPVASYFLLYQKEALGQEVFFTIVSFSIILLISFVIALKGNKKGLFIATIYGLLTFLIVFIVPYSDKIANNEYKDISEIQQLSEIENLQCYTLEDTRIELVWLIGRKIKKVEDTKSLHPPYLLLTDKNPSKYALESNYQLVGYYNNNSKPKGHKHYQESLSKYVSIVKN